MNLVTLLASLCVVSIPISLFLRFPPPDEENRTRKWMRVITRVYYWVMHPITLIVSIYVWHTLAAGTLTWAWLCVNSALVAIFVLQVVWVMQARAGVPIKENRFGIDRIINTVYYLVQLMFLFNL